MIMDFGIDANLKHSNQWRIQYKEDKRKRKERNLLL
jgi:hypothetical protein